MKYLFFFIFLILTQTYQDIQAQDIWINAIPVQAHPSFAGSEDSTIRVAVATTYNSGNPISRHDNTYQQYLSMDGFLSKIRSGIGVMLRYGKANDHDFFAMKGQYLEARLMVAPNSALQENGLSHLLCRSAVIKSITNILSAIIVTTTT